jgi:hypothetical protein
LTSQNDFLKRREEHVTVCSSCTSVLVRFGPRDYLSDPARTVIQASPVSWVTSSCVLVVCPGSWIRTSFHPFLFSFFFYFSRTHVHWNTHAISSGCSFVSVPVSTLLLARAPPQHASWNLNNPVLSTQDASARRYDVVDRC